MEERASIHQGLGVRRRWIYNATAKKQHTNVRSLLDTTVPRVLDAIMGEGNEADRFVCRCRRRNSGLVVESRKAQAPPLICPWQPQSAILLIERSSVSLLDHLCVATLERRGAWGRASLAVPANLRFAHRALMLSILHLLRNRFKRCAAQSLCKA